MQRYWVEYFEGYKAEYTKPRIGMYIDRGETEGSVRVVDATTFITYDVPLSDIKVLMPVYLPYRWE